MLILAIDTSGKSGGITLAEGDQQSFRAFESAPIAGGTFSAQLVPTIAALLHKHGLRVSDVDGFAVVSGPGSFTGLRIGLGAVKGLVEVLNQPIATVSLLEALALSSDAEGKIAAALDAGRAEIYFGIYDIWQSRAVMLSENLLSQSAFVEEIVASGSTCLVTSDASVGNAALATKVRTQEVPRPDSAVIAQIGLRKLLAGEIVSVEALDANYIRRSDAEIFSKAK